MKFTSEYCKSLLNTTDQDKFKFNYTRDNLIQLAQHLDKMTSEERQKWIAEMGDSLVAMSTRGKKAAGMDADFDIVTSACQTHCWNTLEAILKALPKETQLTVMNEQKMRFYSVNSFKDYPTLRSNKELSVLSYIMWSQLESSDKAQTLKRILLALDPGIRLAVMTKRLYEDTENCALTDAAVECPDVEILRTLLDPEVLIDEKERKQAFDNEDHNKLRIPSLIWDTASHGGHVEELWSRVAEKDRLGLLMSKREPYSGPIVDWVECDSGFFRDKNRGVANRIFDMVPVLRRNAATLTSLSAKQIVNDLLGLPWIEINAKAIVAHSFNHKPRGREVNYALTRVHECLHNPNHPIIAALGQDGLFSLGAFLPALASTITTLPHLTNLLKLEQYQMLLGHAKKYNDTFALLTTRHHVSNATYSGLFDRPKVNDFIGMAEKTLQQLQIDADFILNHPEKDTRYEDLARDVAGAPYDVRVLIEGNQRRYSKEYSNNDTVQKLITKYQQGIAEAKEFAEIETHYTLIRDENVTDVTIKFKSMQALVDKLIASKLKMTEGNRILEGHLSSVGNTVKFYSDGKDKNKMQPTVEEINEYIDSALNRLLSTLENQFLELTAGGESYFSSRMSNVPLNEIAESFKKVGNNLEVMDKLLPEFTKFREQIRHSFQVGRIKIEDSQLKRLMRVDESVKRLYSSLKKNYDEYLGVVAREQEEARQPEVTIKVDASPENTTSENNVIEKQSISTPMPVQEPAKVEIPEIKNQSSVIAKPAEAVLAKPPVVEPTVAPAAVPAAPAPAFKFDVDKHASRPIAMVKKELLAHRVNFPQTSNSDYVEAVKKAYLEIYSKQKSALSLRLKLVADLFILTFTSLFFLRASGRQKAKELVNTYHDAMENRLVKCVVPMKTIEIKRHLFNQTGEFHAPTIEIKDKCRVVLATQPQACRKLMKVNAATLKERGLWKKEVADKYEGGINRTREESGRLVKLV